MDTVPTARFRVNLFIDLVVLNTEKKKKKRGNVLGTLKIVYKMHSRHILPNGLIFCCALYKNIKRDRRINLRLLRLI